VHGDIIRSVGLIVLGFIFARKSEYGFYTLRLIEKQYAAHGAGSLNSYRRSMDGGNRRQIIAPAPSWQCSVRQRTLWVVISRQFLFLHRPRRAACVLKRLWQTIIIFLGYLPIGFRYMENRRFSALKNGLPAATFFSGQSEIWSSTD